MRDENGTDLAPKLIPSDPSQYTGFKAYPESLGVQGYILSSSDDTKPFRRDWTDHALTGWRSGEVAGNWGKDSFPRNQ